MRELGKTREIPHTATFIFHFTFFLEYILVVTPFESPEMYRMKQFLAWGNPNH